MHETLELHGVDHTVVGMQNDLYKQPAVRQLIELLTAVNDPQNSTALFHALSGPAFLLPQKQLSELAASAKYDHVSLAAAIADSDDQPFLDALAQIESWRERHADITVGSLAYDIITDSGWKLRLYEQAGTNHDDFLQTQALSEYFKTLKEFERIATIPSVRSYLDNLATLQSSGESFDGTLDISSQVINVMSIHKSKGLEWETVYVIDCVEGSFPMKGGGQKGIPVPAELLKHHTGADDKMAEERRGMYVAITRARSELILSYSDRAKADGQHRKPSRFIAEAFESTPEHIIEQGRPGQPRTLRAAAVGHDRGGPS